MKFIDILLFIILVYEIKIINCKVNDEIPPAPSIDELDLKKEIDEHKKLSSSNKVMEPISQLVKSKKFELKRVNSKLLLSNEQVEKGKKEDMEKIRDKNKLLYDFIINTSKETTDFIGNKAIGNIVATEPFELKDCNQVLIMKMKIILNENDYSKKSRRTFLSMSAYIINFYMDSNKDDLFKSFYFTEVKKKPTLLHYENCVSVETQDDMIKFCFKELQERTAFLRGFDYFYACGGNRYQIDPIKPNVIINIPINVIQESKCELEEILQSESSNHRKYSDMEIFAVKYKIPYNLDVTLLSYGIFRDTITGFSVTFYEKNTLKTHLSGLFKTILFDAKNRVQNVSINSVVESLEKINNMTEEEKNSFIENEIARRIFLYKKHTMIKGYQVYSFILREYELDNFQNKSLMQFYNELSKHVDVDHLKDSLNMKILENSIYYNIANDVYLGKVINESDKSSKTSNNNDNTAEVKHSLFN